MNCIYDKYISIYICMSMAAIRFDKLRKSIHGKFEFDLQVYFSFLFLTASSIPSLPLKTRGAAKVNPFAEEKKGAKGGGCTNG